MKLNKCDGKCGKDIKTVSSASDNVCIRRRLGDTPEGIMMMGGSGRETGQVFVMMILGTAR